MKRIIVYYSLSGNTEAAVKEIAEKLGCETMKIDTVKPMPKAFFAQILVGGGQVAMKKIPEIKPLEKDMNDYDEIFIGTPIWNSMGVPAVNAFLKDESVRDKVTGLIITSGGGEITKAVKALTDILPNIKYQVSLLDKKVKESVDNPAKIEEFVKPLLEK